MFVNLVTFIVKVLTSRKTPSRVKKHCQPRASSRLVVNLSSTCRHFVLIGCRDSRWFRSTPSLVLEQFIVIFGKPRQTDRKILLPTPLVNCLRQQIWLYEEMGVLLGGEGLLYTCTTLKAGFLWCILSGNSPKYLEYVPPNGVVILRTHFRDVS